MDDINKQIQQTQVSSENLTTATNTLSQAYSNVKTNIEQLGAASNSLGKIIGDSAKGFKPMVDNLKTAEMVTSKFRDAIIKANQAYATYSDGIASGKSRFEALKDVFPALNKGVEGGTTGFKNFKIALAETGIGLIVIAVAALIEKLQECKPIMDVINALTAAMGAVMGTLANSIVGLFTHPIDTMKNFGSSMAGAAKDAYQLTMAQEKLKASMIAQELVNNKINDQINLLKKQADNVKLSTADRIKALQEIQRQEEQYYNQNSALAYVARDNAVKELGIKTGLSKAIIADLKNRGAEAAVQLLKDKKINEEQYESIKKADDAIRALDKQHITDTQENVDALQKINDDEAQKAQERREKAKAAYQQELSDIKAFNEEAEKLKMDSATRMAISLLSGYDREVKETQLHFDEMLSKYEAYIEEYNKKKKKDPAYAKRHLKQYQDASALVIQLKKEEAAVLAAITKKFQDDDLAKLQAYENELATIAATAGKNAEELAIMQAENEEKTKLEVVTKAIKDSQKRQAELSAAHSDETNTEKKQQLQTQIDAETALQVEGNKVKTGLETKLQQDIAKIKADAADKAAQKQSKDQQDSIDKLEQGGHHTKALQLQLSFLKQKHDAEIKNSQLTNEQIKNLDEGYAKQKADIEDKLTESKIHAGDKYINAVLANSKKDSAIYKAAFMAKKATSIADVIISTKKSIIASFEGYAGMPFIGQALAIAQAAFIAGQGAASIASIAQQKPGFARGGHYTSDGKGALLPGYSRTDNTNAYLRSGEAVVVSEAMRNPWARNLVSAINVAHGGRDFSTRSTSRGYAIGGIFTDGGNANRYYSQPANDVKDLANTLAYQMINNFPPIYVDVKDVNNQQNILAQTVNRVDL